MVLRLAFVTAVTSLTLGQPKFARCLAVLCAGELYICIFGGSCPLTEFCPLQNSLFVQVLRSPMLAGYCTALQQRSSAELCGVVQEMELGTFTEQQRAPPIFDWAAITLGIGQHSSFRFFKDCRGIWKKGRRRPIPSQLARGYGGMS